MNFGNSATLRNTLSVNPTANGLIFDGTNLGIGTSPSSYRLHTFGADSFLETASGNVSLYMGNSNARIYSESGTGTFNLYSGANVLASFGLSAASIRGTVTFNSPLNIDDNGTTFAKLRLLTGVHYWNVACDESNSQFQIINETGSGVIPFKILSTNEVGIGGTPNTSAILDVQSTTKGFLLPRMDTTARNAIGTPATGLTIYNTTSNTFDFYYNSSWRTLLDNFNTQAIFGKKTFNDGVLIQNGTSGTFITLLGSSKITSSTLSINVTSPITVSNDERHITTLIQGITIDSASGRTHDLISQLAIKPLIINGVGGVATNAAALYIEGAATGTATITNNYALWVDAGTTRLDGEVEFQGVPSATTSDVLYYNSTTKRVSYGTAPSGSLSDGDKGDITVSGSGATWTIDNSAVTLAKIANIADVTILGNNSGISAAPIALTAAQTKTLLSLNNVENTALSTWVGSANITTLGTIATGTWNATAISTAKGGNPTGGSTGQVLKKVSNSDYDYSWQADNTITTNQKRQAITFKTIEASAITTGEKTVTRLVVPYSGTITGWYIVTNTNTTATIDIWKLNAVIPTNANTITASAKPSVTAASYASSSTLTGWTTSVAVGDVMVIEIEANNTATEIALILQIEKD